MKSTLPGIIRHGFYPLLLAVTLLVIHLAVAGGWNLKVTLWLYLLGLLAILIAVERLFPLSGDWSMTASSFRRDVKYLAVSGATIATVRTGFGALAIWIGEHHTGPLAHAPLAVGVIAFLLLFELVQYGFHRLSHEGTGRLGRFLWRVHLAHHLPDRVYVVMHGVFHPVNALITALLIQGCMLLLGLSPQAAFAATLLLDLQTMISHFNVDIRAGLFNYLLIGTELHRYHHSAAVAEAGNYGTVLPIWDLVFGTFRYRPGIHPARLGVETPADYPPSQALARVLALPFQGEPRPNFPSLQKSA